MNEMLKKRTELKNEWKRSENQSESVQKKTAEPSCSRKQKQIQNTIVKKDGIIINNNRKRKKIYTTNNKR